MKERRNAGMQECLKLNSSVDCLTSSNPFALASPACIPLDQKLCNDMPSPNTEINMFVLRWLEQTAFKIAKSLKLWLF